jgi:hypothetical protein
MTYLKDIKLCVDCYFYGNEHGQKDRCINPRFTGISMVTGKEEFPYAFAQRSSFRTADCGPDARFFVLHSENQIAREKARQEFEEAMRDSPF